MTLYIRTKFDNTVRKLNAEKVTLHYKNDDEINTNDFNKYSDIENTGILNIKLHPFEGKRWFNSLSRKVKDGGYVIVWNNGEWLSIPGNAIDFISIER